jgi:hypothetical protein
MHPPKDFSATWKTRNLKKKNGLHDKSIDALIKGKNWLKNRGAKAGTVISPDFMLKLSKTVKTNATIENSDSE